MNLNTKNLFLTRFQEEDLPEVFQLLSSPEVMRFSLHGPYSKEKCLAFIQAQEKSFTDNGHCLLKISLKSNNAFIGYCGITNQTIDNNIEKEIGYRILPAYWNYGYATEASKAIINWAKENRLTSRMIAIIESENYPSIKVALKIGMKLEKESLYAERVPVLIYSMSLNKLYL